MRGATKMNGKTIGAMLALMTAAAGCEVGPNYKPPEMKVRSTFAEANVKGEATTRASVPTTQAATPPVTLWWTTFRDPELNSLIGRAVRGNLTLRQAVSRVRQARYERAIAGAGLFPNVNVDGGYQRARGSNNVLIPLGAFGGGSSSASGASGAAQQTGKNGMTAQPQQEIAGGGGGATVAGGPPGGPQSPLGLGGFPGVDTDLYQIGFDATWEIDVFGGQQRGIEAAGADFAAAQEDARDSLVTLLAETARTYIELRGDQRQFEIAKQNLAAQQDTLSLTRSKYQAGFVTQLDVARQATQVATTAAALPALEGRVRIAIHTLGVLVGEDPDALSAELIKPGVIPPVPPEIPVGLPSDLLRRRPDVRRAERQLAAATARVGQATADLFPKFSITGALGLDSTKPKHLLDWNSRYWALSPGISWPIFDAGRIRANIDVQDEVRQQAYANYQQTVLNALKDVEDSLSSYRTEQLRNQALTDAVDAARQAVDLAKQQYNQGVTDFLTVLDAERAEFAAEDSLAQSDQTISTDLVSLYKALGGGWEISARGG
jgi:NodT family efflux transporter outer membrane factor (OMF) lipoprotein